MYARTWLTVVIGIALLGGCGSDPPKPRLPYATDSTNVIGGDGNFYNPDGGAVSPIGNSGTCDAHSARDVLLDMGGDVAAVVCYPSDGVSVDTFEGPVHDVGNDTVLVVDDKDDGVDVMGDVTIDGNNVTLYGAGPDVSVIGGDLHIDKNNAVVHGVRVQGDVTIDKNNPAIVDCVIEGDLTIRGNNVSVANCEIWGKLTVEGNNAVLVSNKVLTAPEVSGNNLVCNDNKLFSDADKDGKVQDSELGNVVNCTNKTVVKGGSPDIDGGLPGKKG